MRHETLLDGLHLKPAPRTEVFGPSLLRYDLTADLVTSFFNDLRRDDWLEALKSRADLEVRGGLPLVDQGIHRKAVLVAVDAACLTPGFPRLDPDKVTRAALVIRRESSRGGDAPEGVEIWANDAADNPLGWLAAPSGAVAAKSDFDPDANTRRQRLVGRNPALAFGQRITGDADGVSETAHPMFPIPPDLAQKIGRTIYFASLPTTSMSVVPAEAPPPPFSIDDVRVRLPNLFKSVREASLLPPAGGTITQSAYRAATSDGLQALRSTLTWLGQENGFFTGAASADPLRAALASVPISGAAQGNLRDWFDAANAILVEKRNPDDGNAVSFLDRRDGPTGLSAPAIWPHLSSAKAEAIVQASLSAMTARWGDLAPSVSRFGTSGDRYHVRTFLRIDDCPQGCPPRVLWSPLSTSYRIRPWFENSGAAASQIEMPDLTDLSRLKPDVAIKVPPEIQQFMDKLNLDGLMEGEAPKSTLSFGMICGFSIPIITLCAFIVLQIFLSLLNILFFWLPFIKICIPYPKIDTEEGG